LTNPTIKLALAGLGTVGSAVFKLAQEMRSVNTTVPIEIIAVSARDKSRDRGISLDKVVWFDDPVLMAKDSGADIVVELIGGSDGIAFDVCDAALANGKDLVTANKALLAHHGLYFATKAERAGLSIGYEAAVAGAIPVIKALREGLSSNIVQSIYGILNGTCNFILSRMRESGCDFNTALTEAKRRGYAEEDPSFDIDGVDAAHKLSILASVAFGCIPKFESVKIEGIRHITDLDISFAQELGYRIKLLGIAQKISGIVEQVIQPCMVKIGSPMAHVEGVYNAIAIKGSASGPIILEGQGAGADPTASAVLADIIDLTRGIRPPILGVPVQYLTFNEDKNTENNIGRYYVRLMVLDRSGVFAEVAGALRDENVSMEAILQRTRSPGEPVPVVMTTHEVDSHSMKRVLRRLSAIDTVVEDPRAIRIEPLTF